MPLPAPPAGKDVVNSPAFVSPKTGRQRTAQSPREFGHRVGADRSRDIHRIIDERVVPLEEDDAVAIHVTVRTEKPGRVLFEERHQVLHRLGSERDMIAVRPRPDRSNRYSQLRGNRHTLQVARDVRLCGVFEVHDGPRRHQWRQRTNKALHVPRWAHAPRFSIRQADSTPLFFRDGAEQPSEETHLCRLSPKRNGPRPSMTALGPGPACSSPVKESVSATGRSQWRETVDLANFVDEHERRIGRRIAHGTPQFGISANELDRLTFRVGGIGSDNASGSVKPGDLRYGSPPFLPGQPEVSAVN